MPEHHASYHPPTQRLHDLTPALLGLLMGTALQLQQAALWPTKSYMLLVLPAILSCGLEALIKRANRWPVPHLVTAGVYLLAAALLAFGMTGWRASSFASHALNPALEGRDIAVTGVVASLPQRFEGGVRFRFDLETAQLDGQPVALPHRLELAWYAGAFGRSDASGESAGARASSW